jgi:hypothetical protein
MTAVVALRSVLPAALSLGAAALWLFVPLAGQAFTLAASEFLVSVSDGESTLRSIESDVVPYLPDRACFGWRLRFAEPPALARYREVLQLPAAPAFWSGEDDPYSPHRYSADRTTATTEEYAAPDVEGWIASTWCIAEGDPVGPHSVDVYIDGRHVEHFDFEVKPFSEFSEN